MKKFCKTCKDGQCDLDKVPSMAECHNVQHWKIYALSLEEKLDLEDDIRDKLDVANWLRNTEKVRSYNCTACNRDYQIPVHLTYITCVCGMRSRLRHLGGIDENQDVIDAAMEFFGNERSAQLAWIAEVVAGKHSINYSADEIRAMIKNEMDRWELKDTGWKRKSK